jgi:hypothetical protein
MPTYLQPAVGTPGWAPQKLIRCTLPWRALKDISSTKIHWSTFYHIATQKYNTYRALFEPPPAWHCAQISTCCASGSVISIKANEWLPSLAGGLVWRPGEFGLAIQ